MNMKRGVVALTIVVLAATAFIGALTTSAQSVSFTDLTTSYDYYDAVNYLQSENVVQGYDDGTYTAAVSGTDVELSVSAGSRGTDIFIKELVTA